MLSHLDVVLRSDVSVLLEMERLVKIKSKNVKTMLTENKITTQKFHKCPCFRTRFMCTIK